MLLPLKSEIIDFIESSPLHLLRTSAMCRLFPPREKLGTMAMLGSECLFPLPESFQLQHLPTPMGHCLQVCTVALLNSAPAAASGPQILSPTLRVSGLFARPGQKIRSTRWFALHLDHPNCEFRHPKYLYSA